MPEGNGLRNHIGRAANEMPSVVLEAGGLKVRAETMKTLIHEVMHHRNAYTHPEYYRPEVSSNRKAWEAWYKNQNLFYGYYNSMYETYNSGNFKHDLYK